MNFYRKPSQDSRRLTSTEEFRNGLHPFFIRFKSTQSQGDTIDAIIVSARQRVCESRIIAGCNWDRKLEGMREVRVTWKLEENWTWRSPIPAKIKFPCDLMAPVTGDRSPLKDAEESSVFATLLLHYHYVLYITLIKYL